MVLVALVLIRSRYREKYFDSNLKAFAFKSNKGVQGTPEAPTILSSVRAYIQKMKLFPKQDISQHLDDVLLKAPDIKEFNNVNSPWHNFFLWACSYHKLYLEEELNNNFKAFEQKLMELLKAYVQNENRNLKRAFKKKKSRGE
jgi:hypothetical protein